MSGTNSTRNKALIAGAGVLITGVGAFLLHHHLEQKKKLRNLENQLTREEKKSSTNSIALSESEYYTALDSEEEEFKDCMTDEDTLEKQELFREVDILMKGNDEHNLKAFIKLDSYKHYEEEDAEFFWRLAKAHQMRATACGAQNNLEEKKKHVYEGLDYANKALALDKNNVHVHKWLAILKGMEADFLSVKKKIQNAKLFYKHILIGIGLKPDDYSLYYLLGRFKFEIANAPWVHKKVLLKVFPEVSAFTYEDAIEDLLLAEKLNAEPWKENKLLLAKCYIKTQNYKSAVKLLLQARNIISITNEDAANDQEISLLLQKYEKRRK